MRLLPTLWIALLTVGCAVDLKERNNALEDQLTELDAQIRLDESHIHELEHDLDACEQAVQRKAVTEILLAANIDPDRPLSAVLETTMGEIRIELYSQYAPRTVANFVELAEGTRDWTDPRTGEARNGTPLYSDLLFHRVIEGYIIQTGDPLATGYGGPGYTFPDEFSDKVLHEEPGMVSMANSGPDTNGSQFFISLEKARHLDSKHAIFGKVVEGMDVVTAISRVPAGAEIKHRPDQDVYLRRVRIIRD